MSHENLRLAFCASLRVSGDDQAYSDLLASVADVLIAPAPSIAGAELEAAVCHRQLVAEINMLRADIRYLLNEVQDAAKTTRELYELLNAVTSGGHVMRTAAT